MIRNLPSQRTVGTKQRTSGVGRDWFLIGLRQNNCASLSLYVGKKSWYRPSDSSLERTAFNALTSLDKIWVAVWDIHTHVWWLWKCCPGYRSSHFPKVKDILRAAAGRTNPWNDVYIHTPSLLGLEWGPWKSWGEGKLELATAVSRLCYWHNDITNRGTGTYCLRASPVSREPKNNVVKTPRSYSPH